MDIITILTVNFNDTYFKHSLFHALEKLTFNRFKVIVCDNGSNKNQFTELKNLSKKYSFVELITNIQSQTSSYGHGDELNSGIKIIGATNPKERSGKRQGLGNFPLPCFAFFATEVFKKLNINNLPGNISEGQDVCWEWPVKFSEQNYKSKVFETKNTRDHKDGPFASIVGVEEYYYSVNGKKFLFCAHFGRGASGGLNKLLFKSKYLSRLNRFFYLFFFINSVFQKKKWNKIVNSFIVNIK